MTQPTRKRLGVATSWRRVSRPGRPTEIVNGPASWSDDKQQVDRSCDGQTAAQSRLSCAFFGASESAGLCMALYSEYRQSKGLFYACTTWCHPWWRLWNFNCWHQVVCPCPTEWYSSSSSSSTEQQASRLSHFQEAVLWWLQRQFLAHQQAGTMQACSSSHHSEPSHLVILSRFGSFLSEVPEWALAHVCICKCFQFNFLCQQMPSNRWAATLSFCIELPVCLHESVFNALQMPEISSL